MRLKFKNNNLGYFRFFYYILGSKVWISLFLSIMVSFLDGIGLAMFMPLLQVAADGSVSSEKESMGYLFYVTEGIKKLGFPLSFEFVLIFLVIVFALKGILKFLQVNYQVHVRYFFMRKVRYMLVNNLQGLSYTGFLKLDAGRIQNTLISEVQRLSLAISHYFNTAQAIVMLLTYVVLAVLANYQFAILVTIGAGLSNFLYRKIYTLTKQASIGLSTKGHNFNSYLIQAIHNFKYLKSTNYFSSFSKRLKRVINESEDLNKKLGLYGAITTSVREPIIIIIVAAVIYLQINFMGSSLSSILLSLLLFYRSLSFLMNVQNFWHSFINNVGAMEAVSGIADEMDAMQEVKKEKVFQTIESEIHLKEISFSYDTKRVLNSVNFKVKKNQTIALVGESGSGKTTLANMIAGLILPQKGEILIDNENIINYSLDSYRDKIGYISQEPVVFNDDIYNNITFWAERTQENVKRFWEIIEMVSLNNFVNDLKEKELTNLGDNGLLISGGQKQRISIARELFKRSEILILDEATSALDSETEKLIQDNIEKLHGHYTIIIIAHRLSTIKNADTIYLMEKGYVKSSGSFTELMENSQKFKHMVSLQNINLT